MIGFAELATLGRLVGDGVSIAEAARTLATQARPTGMWTASAARKTGPASGTGMPRMSTTHRHALHYYL